MSLKTIGWVAAGFSILGTVLNAWKIIWCWPVWILSNAFWVYWGIRKREWSQVVLWIVYTALNIYGYIEWRT